MQPKSHVKVPDFLRSQLSSSRSALAQVANSVELRQNDQLFSSRTHLKLVQDALNTERRDEKIHVQDWQTPANETSGIKTALDEIVVVEQPGIRSSTANSRASQGEGDARVIHFESGLQVETLMSKASDGASPAALLPQSAAHAAGSPQR